MKKLTRKDAMSIFQMDVDLTEGDWNTRLPEKYRLFAQDEKHYWILKALLYVEAKGIYANIDWYQDKTGLSRQVVSKTLNKMIRLGLVKSGSFDGDSRNKMFSLDEQVRMDLAEVFLESHKNVVHVLENFLTTEATTRLWTEFVRRPLSRDQSDALQAYHASRVSWFKKTNKTNGTK
jgi:DNA-binding transcriptional ArsR family regulator|tara:strand:+ start:1965 stop:2495 length:531 start_codon:yes stop_codon:yes gene_type:complete